MNLKEKNRKCKVCGKAFTPAIGSGYFHTCTACYLESHKNDAVRGGLRVCTHVHEGPAKEFQWRKR